MINNSTNFNKTNYHLSLKSIDHNKKTTMYNIGNSGSDVGRAQKCGGFKPVNRSKIPPPLLYAVPRAFWPYYHLPIYPQYT